MGAIVQLDEAGKVAQFITKRLTYQDGSYTPVAALRTWFASGAAEIAQHRLAEITRAPEPAHDPATQRLVLRSVKVGDSTTVETWSIVALSAAELKAIDVSRLASAGKDMALVLVELVDWVLANTAMAATDFTPQVRQAYLDLKGIADRVKS